MIGNDQQKVVGRETLQHLPDDRIHFSIDVQDSGTKFLCQFRIVARMLRIEETIEHMGDTVSGGEHGGISRGVSFLHFMKENLLQLLHVAKEVFKKDFFTDFFFVQAPGFVGPAERFERTKLFTQRLNVASGIRKRQSRIGGSKADRHQVKAHLRESLQEVEAAYSAEAHKWPR